MTDVNAELLVELVTLGLEPREARWLVEEFVPGADPDAATALRLAARRRLAGEPLQYVLGHWPFRSLDLDVDARVLIPRPETEELVGHALDALAQRDLVTPTILDLGCGSGAIGLSLVYELLERGVHATLLAVDASPDALAVAKRNALKHRLLSVTFVESSWFESVPPSLRGHVDLIVANPPYVGVDEFARLDPVLGYEPLMALVAPDRDGTPGFADLDDIIRQAPQWLSETGVLVVEHGNAQRDAVTRCARAAGFRDVVDYDDLAGHPRVLVASR